MDHVNLGHTNGRHRMGHVNLGRLTDDTEWVTSTWGVLTDDRMVHVNLGRTNG